MKKILVLLVLITTVIVSMANVDHENSNNQLSELTLSSIDALADGEKGCVNGPNCTLYCINTSGYYTCESYWIWNCITAIN